MNNIITTTEVQKNIGTISRNIEKESYIVTSHGKGKIIMLPYFDGCQETIEEYMEDYQMLKNKDKLQQKYTDSLNSGPSDLII